MIVLEISYFRVGFFPRGVAWSAFWFTPMELLL